MPAPAPMPHLVSPPAGSRILATLPGADFADAWAVAAAEPGLSALGQFLKAVRATPALVEACMRLRNRDRHLEVVLSVHTTGGGAATPTGPAVVTITTVVHVHNLLGRLYMLPVAPMHRRIAPAVLRALG